MIYETEFKPRAVKDLKNFQKADVHRIILKIEEMSNDLTGDIKKLTNFTPEYRLRVGDYRILFEIEDDKIVIYRIKHRKEVYRK